MRKQRKKLNFTSRKKSRMYLACSRRLKSPRKFQNTRSAVPHNLKKFLRGYPRTNKFLLESGTRSAVTCTRFKHSFAEARSVKEKFNRIFIVNCLKMFKKILPSGRSFVNKLKALSCQNQVQIPERAYCKQAKKTYPKKVFSGIQPTGTVHLGNYLGAIQNWVELQNNGENVTWSIVDMHSITLPYSPQELRENIVKLTATLLACGIDPEKSILFQQSTVPMHAELSWIFSCLATMVKLTHQPQYKEKSEKLKDVPLGLYVYPILQTADILLYKATHVPVGEDQLQHINLAQHLAQKFNSTYGETFPMPLPIIDNNAGRIKSLRDPTKKMSKSDTDIKSRLDLTDTPDVLLNKIKKALTDFTSEVTYDPNNRPGVANLINIHSMLTGKTPEEICKEAEGLETAKYKLLLADVVIEKINPIRKQIEGYMEEPGYLKHVLQEGARKAEVSAIATWLEVRTKVGYGIDTLSINMDQLHMYAR